MADKEKSYHRIAAVQKTCRILAELAEAKTPLSGLEIASLVQESQGTVMSHLATLQDSGLVQEVGGGWRLGMKMAIYWARIRSTMESERDKLTNNIRMIGGE